MIQNSYELLYALKKAGYLKNERDPLWWPDSGTEKVIVGTLLTQQTRWENVEKSLTNLQRAGLDTLSAISRADTGELASLIKPSGFYNTKAERLKQLSTHILETFGDFETFREEVDREWLLSQKGIGPESADSILCYGCGRDLFVVDSYTGRLLEALGYQWESYGEIQEWVMSGLEENFEKVVQLYGEEIPYNRLYARLHGKIVEYAKEHIRGKRVEVEPIDKILK